MRAARHEVIARALRGRLRQHRRLDVEEFVRVEIVAQHTADLRAQCDVALHARRAQVNVAVFQTRIFVNMVLVDLKRNRRGSVQDLEILDQDFDLAGHHIGVFRALGAPPYPAFRAQHEFAANALGRGETLRRIGVDHDLDDPGAITQVDKDYATVVAPIVDPTADGDFAVEFGFGNLSAVMTTHGWVFCRLVGGAVVEAGIIRTGPRSSGGSTARA